MQFLAPAFLLLLPLALIPPLIHLFSRLRLQQRQFPSLMLLESVRRERWSWIRLREVLLLVLRTLFLLLIPLALSRPRLEVRLPFRLGSDRVLVILDHSYSMAYGNRWSRARAAARELIRQSARPLLIITSRPDTVLNGRNTLLRLLDTLSPSALAPTLKPALNQAQALSRQSPMPVILITDLQMRALPEPDSLSWPAGLQILSLASDRFDNAGITALTPENSRLRVRIFNYGSMPVTRTVRLELEGYLEEKTVSIPARTAVTAELPLPADRRRYSGQVALSPDSLPVDDIRYFVHEAPSRLRVPIFWSTSEEQARYLRLALAADTLLFQPVLLPAAELRRTDISRYPVIIIADAGALRPADLERLDYYLNSGGAALLCAPSLPALSGNPFFPLRYDGPVNHSGFVRPAEVDTTHPLLAGFHTRDFNTVRVFAHSRITGGRIIIRLTNGDPLVIELPEKRLIIWTLTPMPEATDLIYRAAFAPLVHQTVRYLAGISRRQEWQAGDTVVMTLDAGEPLRLIGPEGERTVIPESEGTGPVIRITTTRTPGIYRLENRDTIQFAINPRPEEGDLTPVATELLTRQGISIHQGDQDPARELTGPLLYLAAVMLLLELLLLGASRYRKMPVRR